MERWPTWEPICSIRFGGDCNCNNGRLKRSAPKQFTFWLFLEHQRIVIHGVCVEDGSPLQGKTSDSIKWPLRSDRIERRLSSDDATSVDEREDGRF